MSLVFKMDTRQQSLKFIILFLRQCSLTDTNFSSYDSHLDYNLGQNKMAEQANRTPPPPPPIKDKAAQKRKRAIFLSQIWGGGWGKRRGINFHFSSVQDILSVIVAGVWILHCMVVLFFSLWLNQLKSFQILKTNLKLTSCSLWLVYGGGRKGRGKSLLQRRVQTSRLQNPLHVTFFSDLAKY